MAVFSSLPDHIWQAIVVELDLPSYAALCRSERGLFARLNVGDFLDRQLGPADVVPRHCVAFECIDHMSTEDRQQWKTALSAEWGEQYEFDEASFFSEFGSATWCDWSVSNACGPLVKTTWCGERLIAWHYYPGDAEVGAVFSGRSTATIARSSDGRLGFVCPISRKVRRALQRRKDCFEESLIP